ncbi:hypothetical protein [Streptomyces alboflavus]|uniref:hypothetical protein n=1 Tax=Streptomyces alboflavus TaxID=67267 RepID=UPI00369382C6
MARGNCGCGGTCNCELQVEPPLKKTGSGAPGVNPWKLSLEFAGKTGCAGLLAYMNPCFGPGLVSDSASGKLQIRLSRDDGQVARFGSDQGLLVTNGTGPTPETCTRGISSLPEAPNVVGASDLAGLLGPYSSPYQLAYCLAEGVDVIHFHTATSSDDVGVVTDYWDHMISSGRTSLYVAQDVRQMNAATCQSAYNYAGDTDDPQSHNWGDTITIPQRKDRRGGWYGWLAQRYHQPLVSDFMREVHGQAVVLLDAAPDPSRSEYPESEAIIGPMRSVLENCAQGWSMIGVRDLANAATVIARGITACMIPLVPEKWGETALPYPVAQVTGAGVKWMVLSHRYADAVLTAYKDAGINVLMRGRSRQADYQRVKALGLRGALQADPVYYRGPGTVPELWPYGFRSEYDPWEHRNIGTGQLTFRTDQYSVLSDSGLVRGRCESSEQGLIIPRGFGNGIARPGILVGWRLPLTNSSSYTVTWDVKWNSMASLTRSAKVGLLFGSDKDDDTYAWPNDAAANPAGYPEGQKTLYRASLRQNGELFISKWPSQSGNLVELVSQQGAAVTQGDWNSFKLTVTPADITFERTDPSGTKTTCKTTDTQYRGGYFWLEKEETLFGSSANPFEAKVRNLQATPAV